MAYYYLDASALVKYYIREPGTTWVRRLIDSRSPDGNGWANTVSIAEVSLTESAAAVAILARMGRIRRGVRDRVFRKLLSDAASGRFRLWPVATEDFHAAAHLTQRYPLKAYDAPFNWPSLYVNSALWQATGWRPALSAGMRAFWMRHG